MAETFDIEAVRRHFPALNQDQVFFDNAGGSQVLKEVIDRISEYLSSTNVQMGASYPVGQESTTIFSKACAAVATYINAKGPEEIVLGPSTTQLFRNLSQALHSHIQPGDEIIISKLDHEANIASWVRLATDRSAKIIWWQPASSPNPQLSPSNLTPLLSPRTKLVACTHTSNILGTIHPIRAIADTIHALSPSALLCVDAVAYAPHREINMAELGADIYSFSWYKVYGPHMACMYASSAAQKRLNTLGHFFKPTDSLENLLGLAAANYELTASLPAVIEYLQNISWPAIAAYEERLQAILLEFLTSKDGVTVYGEPVPDKEKRVPVVSFGVKGRSSRSVVEAVEGRSFFGCRWGSFYSNRLVEEVLGLDAVDGVVRVSLVHYNSEKEVRDFIKVLDQVLSS
ncbi:hypothetical protein MBLNU230_g8572t1 [Neophaeotheca triangularis]